MAIYRTPGNASDEPWRTIFAFDDSRGIDGLRLADLEEVDILDDLFDLPMRVLLGGRWDPVIAWREIASVDELGVILAYDDEDVLANFAQRKRGAYRVRDDAGPLSSRYGLLRELLMAAWDPKGVADMPEAADEYDRYLEDIYRMVVSRQSASRIGDVLYRYETDGMGLPGDRIRAEGAACRLLALRADPRW
jgi:hypothetical protein